MKPDITFRKKIYIVILISILFRFGFLLFGDILPVMWDARRYVSASIGLISYIDDSGDVAYQTPLQDRERFLYYTDKYIQGEQIEWLKYRPFRLTEARNEIFIGGPLYPMLCGAIIYLSPVADFTLIRIVNILLDVLANLLLILIAVRLIGRKGAIIAGIFYALYFPFTLLTSMMLLESSTTLLILLAIYYLMRAFEDNNTKFYIYAGLASGLMILNKPTALLLFVPILISFYWYTKKELVLKEYVKKLSLFFIPFAIIGLCWLTIASTKYGQLTLRDPSYSEANLRQSSNITFEGYDLDKVEKDFWNYSIAEHISNDKLGYVGLLTKKFERMWSKTANDFQNSYILPASIWEYIHLFLVVAGLFGLILLMQQNSKAGIWILLIVLYYSAIHVIYHSVARYSFNALPLLFIASSFFFIQLKELLQAWKSNHIFWSVIGLCFVAFWRTEYLNSIFHLTLNHFVVFVSMIIVLALAFASLYSISKAIHPQKKNIYNLTLPLVSILVFSCCFYSTVLSRNEWSEFSCKISDSQVTAGNKIFIEPQTLEQSNGLYAVLIDLNSGADRENSFNVTIADSVYQFVGGKPPLSDLFYPKPTYRFYAQFIPLGLEEFRQYAIIEVPYEKIQQEILNNGFLDIAVSINNNIQEDNNYVNLYGTFATDEEINFIPGIRFTSVERYVHKGDPRIRYPVKFLSKKVISYYIDSTGEIQDDLSPSSGPQIGRYNIFVVHFFPNGEFKVY